MKIPIREQIFLEVYLNRYVGKDSRGHERVIGGQGFRERNELGDVILEFALGYVWHMH